LPIDVQVGDALLQVEQEGYVGGNGRFDLSEQFRPALRALLSLGGSRCGTILYGSQKFRSQRRNRENREKGGDNPQLHGGSPRMDLRFRMTCWLDHGVLSAWAR
jgi:hypothetical protein